jgi:hypothetical protein
LSTPAARAAFAEGGGILAEVVADETARRVALGHGKQRRAPTAACVEHVDPRHESPLDHRDQRQHIVEQARGDGLAAVFRHELVEAGIVAIGHPVAGLKAADHAVLHLAQQRDVLGIDGEVAEPARAGEAGGVLRRQPVAAVRRVVVDDPRHDHHRQPLTHIALGEFGAARDLGARRRRQIGHDVEQAEPVPDRHHRRRGTAAQQVADVLGEALRRRLVEVARRGMVMSMAVPFGGWRHG